MNAYGFNDQAIANALQEQGLYTPQVQQAPMKTTIEIRGYQGGNEGQGNDWR